MACRQFGVCLGWVLCTCLLSSQLEPEAFAAWCHLCVGSPDIIEAVSFAEQWSCAPLEALGVQDRCHTRGSDILGVLYSWRQPEGKRGCCRCCCPSISNNDSLCYRPSLIQSCLAAVLGLSYGLLS